MSGIRGGREQQGGRRAGLAAVAASLLAAGGVMGCGSGDDSHASSTSPAGSATAGAGAAPAAATAAARPSDDLTPDGATLGAGQTARVLSSYGAEAPTGPYRLTVSVQHGSPHDLSHFELDAQSKQGVPFYVTERVENVGDRTGKTAGWGGSLAVRNAAGDELPRLTLLGDFPRCRGHAPDALAPREGFTECDVYIAPAGQSVASVDYRTSDNTTAEQTTITWRFR